MRTNTLLCLAASMLLPAAAFAADGTPFAGNWATSAYGDVDEPEKAGLWAKIIAGAVNNGNSGGAISNSQQQNTAADEPGQGGFVGERTEPPIAIEVKVEKGKTKVTISEVVLVPTFKIKKLKPDALTVTADKFEFLTIEKSAQYSNTIRWIGELSAPNVLKVTRQTKAGSPIDDGPILFYRAK